MLDEHDSPQWYDIVHFENKLSWLCLGLPKNVSPQWREYSLFINPWPKGLTPMERVFFVYKPMMDFHHPTPPLGKVRLPLIEARLLWSLSHFLLPSSRLDSFFFWSLLFDIWGFTNLLARLSLGHGSDIMLDEHGSPQWYDIVHFEHNLSCFALGFL